MTLAELEALDLTAPSETEAQAIQNGTATVIETDGYEYVSWMRPQVIHGMKHVMAGSRSARPWYCPGWVRAYCDFQLSNQTYKYALTPRRWGYRITATPKPCIYEPQHTYHFDVYGSHSFNTIGWQYYSKEENLNY